MEKQNRRANKKIEEFKVELIDYFYKGGDIMWVILFTLVIELSIIIERGFFYLLNSYSYEKYEKYLKSQLQQKDISQVSPAWEIPRKTNWFIKKGKQISLFRLKSSVLYKMAKAYLNSTKFPPESRQAILKSESSLQLGLQEKYLSLLSLIGQISPLLGLLGTVTGMIKAFFVIASLGGQVDVTQLAGGISEAMITTAFGLITAIPAYIAYEMYQKVTDGRVEKINRVINLLDEYYHQNKQDIDENSQVSRIEKTRIEGEVT